MRSAFPPTDEKLSVQQRDDRAEKRRRVLAIAQGRPGVDRVLLTSPAATSWYLDGARTQVALLGTAVVAIEVGPRGDVVHVGDNEAERLLDEELPAGVVVKRAPWHSWGADVGPNTLRESDAEVELRRARTPLLPNETRRLRRLGHDAATIMTDVLAAAEPDWTELDVAAALAAATTRTGAEPVVLLVAGESRLHHRHPLPTEGRLGRRTMAVLSARRHGLIVNLTRWLSLRDPLPAEQSAQAGIRQVEAAFLAASRPGATLAEAFREGCASYGRNGFAGDEWERHHQGGMAGYNGRDPRAGPAVDDVIRAGSAVAWNPTARGAKVEDTILVTASGHEVLTVDPRWPTETVHGLLRPVEWVR